MPGTSDSGTRSRLAAARRSLAGAVLAGALAVPGQAADPPDPAAAPSAPLVVAVAGWVAADLGLPMPEALPRVVLVAPGAMARARDANGAEPPHDAPGLVAFYDMRTRTMYLPAGWRADDPAAVSVLVHEMVHHFQAAAGLRYACPGAREGLAYDAQRRWLERFGLTLEEAIGIDPLMLLVATNCLF